MVHGVDNVSAMQQSACYIPQPSDYIPLMPSQFVDNLASFWKIRQ
jgi:hypothetical protein